MLIRTKLLGELGKETFHEKPSLIAQIKLVQQNPKMQLKSNSYTTIWIILKNLTILRQISHLVSYNGNIPFLTMNRYQLSETGKIKHGLIDQSHKCKTK